MQPLNETLIKHMIREQSAVNTGCPLFTVLYPNSVAISDNTIIIEWQNDHVFDCKPLGKLRSNRDHDRALWGVYEKEHWIEQFIVDDFYNAEEIDPADDENAEVFESIGGTIIFETGDGERSYYHASYISIIEASILEPSYAIYTPPSTQNMPKDMKLLLAFDGDDLVAAVVHQPVRQYAAKEK